MGDRPGERSPNGQPVAVPLWAHPRPLAGRGPASDRRYRAARAYRAGVRPTRRGKWRGGGGFVGGTPPGAPRGGGGPRVPRGGGGGAPPPAPGGGGGGGPPPAGGGPPPRPLPRPGGP